MILSYHFRLYLSSILTPAVLQENILMHHTTILEVLAVRNPASVRGMVFMLVLIAVFTLIRAWILKTVTDALLRSASGKKVPSA